MPYRLQPKDLRIRPYVRAVQNSLILEDYEHFAPPTQKPRAKLLAELLGLCARKRLRNICRAFLSEHFTPGRRKESRHDSCLGDLRAYFSHWFRSG
jgi:hypothetical protein